MADKKKLPQNLFSDSGHPESVPDCSEDEQTGQLIADAFKSSGLDCRIRAIHHGPTVTLYELTVDSDLKVSSVLKLEEKIARVLGVEDVSIIAPLPEKNAIGVEVPNRERTVVRFRSMIDALNNHSDLRIPVALGKDVYDNPVVIDLAGCPSILVGGRSGAGKTSFLDSLICSILCTKTAEEVKLIIVDTKAVEFPVYNGIPHLQQPVITDSETAIKAMEFVMEELERRIGLFSKTSSRKIGEYNSKVPEGEKLPYLVMIIDEFSDLMFGYGKEFEHLIKRITAVARFCGIHLVFSTRFVSADVISGVIKSNIATQIAFAVPGTLNSRIIMDRPGAEKLLGAGDMLYCNPESRRPVRIQGATAEAEIAMITDYFKA